MSFVLAQPLGLLALAALPLIVWLHRFVLHAERREVSSLALWRDRQELAHEGSVQRRVADRAILALELLAAAALALVLAGFDVRTAGASEKRLALVVDGSLSMAGGTGPARPLARVRAHLAELARREPALRVTVIAAADGVQLLGAPGQTPAQADAALAAYAPHGTSAQLTAASALAAALGFGAEETLVLSDDARQTRGVHVGRPEPNTAIVHASWRAGEAPFVVLRRFGPEAKVTLHVEARGPDGSQRSERQLALAPEREQPLRLPVAPDTQALAVWLDADALPLDDRADLLAPRTRPLRVFAAPRSPALARALERVERSLPGLLRAAEPEAELRVLEDPPAPPPSAAVVFVTRAPAPSTLAAEPAADPFSRLLGDFSPRGLYWYAFDLPAPAGAEVLLRDGARPLLYRQALVYTLNVDLARSNLLEHPAFPILFEHVVSELRAARGGLPASNFQQSERIRFAREAAWRGPLSLRGPGGVQSFEEGREIDLGLAPEPGLYTLLAGGVEERFAVQLAAAEESELRARRPEDPLPALWLAPRSGAEPTSRARDVLLLCALGSCLAAYVLLQRKARAA